MEMLHELLEDTTFWYGVSFFVFAWIIVHFGGKPILDILDAEIAKVRAQLEDAKRMHAEAESQLAEYRNKHQTASQEAAAIVSAAKDEASRMRAQAEVDLRNTLALQEQKAMDRIRIAEENAMSDVRTVMIDQAMKAVRENLSQKMDFSTATRLVDLAISEIPNISKR